MFALLSYFIKHEYINHVADVANRMGIFIC